MENYLRKTHKPRICFTTHNFSINGEPHKQKPHNPRTKCTYFRFDSTWEAIGCHTSENGDTTLIRCTCEKDLCNAPITDNSMYESILASSSPYSNMLSMYYLFGTTLFAFIISHIITY